jgi:hypothetical protein
MSWEGFMQMKRRRLGERREGKLRIALGPPLPGESSEQLDRIGERDRRRAEEGLMALVGEGGKISYKHIDDSVRQDMYFVTAAEQVEWFKERLERRRKGAGPPPIPHHLG